MCETIQNISNIVVALAAVVTAGFAVRGVNAWRQEFVGRRRIELAENVLELFYEAKDAIAALRSPFGYLGEGSSREQCPSESEEEREQRDHANVTFERYNAHNHVFNRLKSLNYRFKAQVGIRESKPFEDLRKIVNNILLSAQELALGEAAGIDSPDDRKKLRRVVYSMMEGDEIAAEVDAVCKDIQGTCESIIHKK